MSPPSFAVSALLLLGWCCAPPPGNGAASPIVSVAVASSFAPAMETLQAQFEQEYSYRLQLSFGSTGMLFAQIQHGAPYQVFLAADAERPQQLVVDGLAAQNSTVLYAQGTLALWRRDSEGIADGEAALRALTDGHLAIANPRLAPYGTAAEQFLRKVNLWEEKQAQLVLGQNIGQCFQFVNSGNATFGLVAYAQILAQPERARGSTWIVPKELYPQLDQHAVLLQDSPGARAFLTFLHSEEAQKLIRQAGYTLPDA